MLLVFFSSSSAWAASVVDFGAKGDGLTDDTKAVQAAVDDCAAKGEKLVFPAGTFLTGTIFLRNNTAIELTAKAVWRGIDRVDSYPLQRPRGFEKGTHSAWRAMIYAYDVENISISGAGTFDGNGGNPVFVKTGENPNRPFGLWIVRSRNIRLDGIHMRNTAHWMQHYMECDRIRINGIRVFNHANLNNDGLDFTDCRDVIVSNVQIDSSDDALVLKSDSVRGNADFAITNCILSSHADGFKLGTGSVGGFKRITASNLVIRPSQADHIEHPMKMKNGLGGIDMMSTDGGPLEDIVIQNVVIEGVETPIVIKLGDRWMTGKQTGAGHAGAARNIMISNVIARHCGALPSQISGYPGHPVENVTLSDMLIEIEGGGEQGDLNVPENSSAYPYNRIFGKKLPAFGFFVRHARNLQMRDVRMQTIKSDARYGMIFEDAKGALDNVTIANRETKNAAVLIDKKKSIDLRGDSKELKVRVR
ncbi:glycoside hydrolase [bacterium]|nr:glycoside hydrolase [bacterium]